MRITWRDGVTTIIAAGAVVLERAYFHNWDWPLVSNTRWAITDLFALMTVGFLASYVFDMARNKGWSWIGGLLGLAAVVIAGLGMYFNHSDYVVLMMLTTVLFWMASVVRHATVQSSLMQPH